MMLGWIGRSTTLWPRPIRYRSRAGTLPGWRAGPPKSDHPGGTNGCFGLGSLRCSLHWTSIPAGAKVLAGAGPFPPTIAATEPWPPNIALATRLLHPLGVVVVSTGDEPPLPFAEAAFDLVTSRHPSAVWWDEIARVLRPGGTYFAQHVGVIYLRKLIEYFVGPQPQTRIRGQLNPDTVDDEVAAAGLEVVDLRHEQIQLEFFDVGAVIYFLRKLSWVVPDFAVDKYRDKLLRMHQEIDANGAFVTHSSRVLIEARKAG